MSGAGISTASGIQDFRSPGSGVYDNLSKYNLPYPEAVFELEYFKKNPKPFNSWAKQFFPGVNYLPNTGHYFIKLLEEKGKLSKLFTQNIDGLERIAGIKEDKLVEAHGTFNSASCISCKEAYSIQTLKTQILEDITPTCHKCQGLIKPNIIFFGEPLPGRFFDEAEFDCMFADLLICIGTSLEVYPFAGIADVTRHTTPRILLNNDLVGSFGTRPNDSVLLGDINASIEKICDRLGWSQQILDMNNLNKPIKTCS
ncbi:NAD-dependent protein deacetylase sirtuin-3, mitochondrial isoform X2 [Eurytemora carolleeae]|nr:NAD-dependent protein deacetylase sirtuin-3, mitochondrial isoform X2 [Eurytemora carolleeae]|eukprot:XP_023339957.1 NAD-dependent protein deacetylase sirtuin-3, mitochondrial-like isoform X2 [Eurytemora affinis]